MKWEAFGYWSRPEHGDALFGVGTAVTTYVVIVACETRCHYSKMLVSPEVLETARDTTVIFERMLSLADTAFKKVHP